MKNRNVGEAIELLDAAIKGDRSAGASPAKDSLRDPIIVDALYAAGCDIAARPKDAPTLDDIQPHIKTIRRTPQRLIVEFDPAAAATFAAYVAAEQKCCSDIRFTIASDNPAVMHIDAPSQLLDVVVGWITPA